MLAQGRRKFSVYSRRVARQKLPEAEMDGKIQITPQATVL